MKKYLAVIEVTPDTETSDDKFLVIIGDTEEEFRAEYERVVGYPHRAHSDQPSMEYRDRLEEYQSGYTYATRP